MEKPILFGTKYIMKPGMTYRDICEAMRLDETEMEAGILALEMLNGPEAHTKDSETQITLPAMGMNTYDTATE
jgi:hypothetical protein